MSPEFEVIAHLPDCRNGNCSTVWRHRVTGAIRLRGQDPNDPAREIDIEWSAADFARLAPQLAAFGAQ